MNALTGEEAEQRRLAREARTTFLGRVCHPQATGSVPFDRVRVEVTYGVGNDFFAFMDMHSGYYLVLVPEIESEGLSDDEAMAAHPATLATDAVHEWVQENRNYDYFAVDDVFPA